MPSAKYHLIAFGLNLKVSDVITTTPNLDIVIITTLAVAVLVLVLFFVVVFLYIGEKRRSTAALEQAKAEWRADQMELLRAEQREKAQAEALLQLELWKSQELEVVRSQQTDMARREAQVEIDQWKVSHSKEIRQDAIQKSQAVVTGKVTEHFIPYLPEFHFNPKDARFLGTPIDFVVFDGLDEGKVKRVVFVEVKTGASQLTTRERQVRDAVEARSVEWLVMRPQLSQKSSTVTASTRTEYLENFPADGHAFEVIVDNQSVVSR